MTISDICHLPFELVLKISEYLNYNDIWCLGTCSRQTRVLSYQILKQKYGIDLIQPRIINPFGHLIHSAVAYIERYGVVSSSTSPQTTTIETSVLQSVANHMAIAIYDRIPSKTGRAISLDFLLDKTLGILLDHCLHDPTLMIDPQQENVDSDNNTNNKNVDYSEKLGEIMSSTQQQEQQHQVNSTEVDYTATAIEEEEEEEDIYAIKSTGILMVDYLAVFYQIISALFDTESASDIHHRLLLNHLNGLLKNIKHKYHVYHTNLSSYSHKAPIINPYQPHNYNDDFKLFIKFLCTLIQTDLVTAKDIEDFTLHHINNFFMTRPSDVSFTAEGGFKIVLRNPNQNLAIINTVTKDKKPAFYYQYKLWLQETQFRISILLDLIRAIVQKHYSSSSPPELKQFTFLLQDAVSALTLSQNMTQQQQQQHNNSITDEQQQGRIIPIL